LHVLQPGAVQQREQPLRESDVGATGRVVGLDTDPVFLDHARRQVPGNVEFVRADAYRTGLPTGAFDLVHTRFVASTAGEPEALLREAIRLARPGGTVALQEPDMAALEGAFTAVGADIRLAQRLFVLLRRAGLQDVQYRPFLVGVRSTDPLVDYLPSTVESLRRTIVDRGLMADGELDAALADCRAHLRDPETVFTTYVVAQVWGRSPRASENRL
jgi:SAM-dependent methyltransferase